MSRSGMPRAVPIAAILALAVALLLGAPSAFGDGNGSAPPPENLRLVLGDDGFVERVAWDPPSGSSGTLTYDFNYRFPTEDEFDVFTRTPNTYLTAWGGAPFGRFVECTPDLGHDYGWIINVTYQTASGSSLPSNVIRMCLP